MSVKTPIQSYWRKEHLMENIEIFEFVFDFNIEDNYDYCSDDNRKELLESLAD